MATISRAGTGLLLAVGLVLAVLMMSLLTPEGVWPEHRSPSTEVAVFFPDREDWLDLQAGIEACARRGLVRGVRMGEDVVTVETPGGRPVRFTWYNVRGLLEAKD